MILDHDTIVAPATARGGALSVVRVSGEDAIAICDGIFRGHTALSAAKGYTLHYGEILDGARVVDDVLLSLFRAPHSYTGEDAVEISCHGSQYIVSELMRLLTAAGARPAEAGEFTIRAYLAGKLDLSQAEAVADVIASSSRAAHTLAANQMRGGVSTSLDALRDKLLNLTSLLELELDFSEEEVEFADRTTLRRTIVEIEREIDTLRQSFALGNAIKEGVAVAIVGAPNAGKSTLLNRLLGEDRAMVSEIAGTTRDVIEECINIDGVTFRFLDTAGIRSTNDRLEQMGIERTMESIRRARIVIHLLDATTLLCGGTPAKGQPLTIPQPEFALRNEQHLITVINKTDALLLEEQTCNHPRDRHSNEKTNGATTATLRISAKQGTGIDALKAQLRASVNTEALYHGDTVISSSRHYEALTASSTALRAALSALDASLPADLLSEHIREVIHHLSAITSRGVIASDEVLQNIFSKFCIGK